ncbi:MAG: TonB-dependent receptor, partial [Caulobacteraceae bacterium]
FMEFKRIRAQRLLATSSAGVLAGLFMLGATPAAAADQAGAPDAATVGEVVVTAQFREQNVQQTPIAITAINAASLEARSQTNLLQVAQQAPNVTLQHGSGSTGPTMATFIRGVGQSDFNFAFEPGVGTYIDDVYFSTTLGSLFDLLDLDRVEILRGPQGTLAGMNSIGGSIKLYSKKPNGNGGGFVQATYGRFNRAEFRGSGDFTVVPDKLFLRISGTATHQDGYVTRYDYACTHPALAASFKINSGQTGSTCKLGTEGGKSYGAVRASLRWVPTEKLEVNLIGDYTHDRSEAIPQTLIYVGTVATPVATTAPFFTVTPGTTNTTYPRFTSAPTGGLNMWNPTTNTSPYIAYSPYGNYSGDTFSHSPYINYSTYTDVLPSDGSAPWAAVPQSWVSGYGVSGQIDYKFNDNLKFTNIASYRHYDAYWAQDYDGSPLSNAQLTYDIWHWQFSEEARLNGQMFGGKVDWVVGGFYFKQKSHYGGRNELGPFEFIEDDTTPAHNEAVFANASWRITDKLELNGGIRYSKEHKTFIFGRGGVPGNTYPALCAGNGKTYTPAVHPSFCALNGVSGTFDGDNIDYRGVLQYQWTPDFMTYVSIATGFKGGGINPRPFFPDNVRPFDPETLTSYEVGFKSNLLDRKVRVNVSLFDSEYKSFIAGVTANAVATQNPVNPGCFFNTSETPNCSFYVNAGNARLRGAELEVQARPVAGLLIDGSLSYLNFKWKTLTGCSLLLTPTGCPGGNAGGLGANIRYGFQAPFSPHWKYSIGAQYEIPLGFGSITPRLDLSYQSDFYGNVVNNTFNRVPGYTLLNGRVTFRPTDSMWEASFEVTNLTNKLYYYSTTPNNSNATVTGQPAPPRQWAVTVKRKF